MSPPVFCPSCNRTYFNARPENLTCLRCGTALVPKSTENGHLATAVNGHSPAPPGVRHRLSADTRALRATQSQLARILADVDTHESRRVRFVVTELIAQSIRRDSEAGPGIGLVELTVEVRERTVRVEAEGPGVPVRIESGRSGPLGNVAFIILDELATDWGSAGGAHPSIWFEVERTPEAAPATRS